MTEDLHIDMSERLYRNRTVGIASVYVQSRKHSGCVIKKRLLEKIQRKLYSGNAQIDNAKLYAICIYLLIKGETDRIKRLIICNDENFRYVSSYLGALLDRAPKFDIINISELRKITGKNTESLADNYARHYRKRALNKNKWTKGIKLRVVEVDYYNIEKHWNKLKEM
jgi:hypothetical protein